MASLHWGFPLSNELYDKALRTIESVRHGETSARAENKALAEVVNQLVKEGLQAYYHIPAELVGLSPTLRAATDKSMQVITGAIRMVTNQFFGGLSQAELVLIADYIGSMLVEPNGRELPHLIFELEDDFGPLLRERLEQARASAASIDDVHHLTRHLQKVVDICLVHYYRQPVDQVSLGVFTRKTADAGIRTVQKAFHSLLTRLLSNLKPGPLARLSDHLSSLVHEDAPAEETPSLRADA
ncbi:hypothetical protein [Mangrovitalea sediminis]|uniref:hypothetical protein n=1 Tax=Mangrovitalea sediminis TaxID=1982043 RepID=UPI000BE5C911|nr:hypothetical protein [Mangrovitalea sediminis]